MRFGDGVRIEAFRPLGRKLVGMGKTVFGITSGIKNRSSNLTMHSKSKPFAKAIYHTEITSNFHSGTWALNQIRKPRWSYIVLICSCRVVVCCFHLSIHIYAIQCSALRTSETILCLWVTAPTRCVRHDRWVFGKCSIYNMHGIAYHIIVCCMTLPIPAVIRHNMRQLSYKELIFHRISPGFHG